MTVPELMSLHIDYGDGFTVGRDLDGNPAVKVQNGAWIEDPRFVTFAAPEGRARDKQINEFIDALTQLTTRRSPA